LPGGYLAAPGAATDAASELPKRVIHQASGIAFVLIAPGEFTMGSPKDEPDRLTGEDQHRRVIRHPFYLGESEVTVPQFRWFVTATQYQTDAESGTPVGAGRVGPTLSRRRRGRIRRAWGWQQIRSRVARRLVAGFNG